jgi:hypothetical protein
MAGARSRYYRGQPCCEGRAPEWDYLYEGAVGGLGGPLSADEKTAISAVENYGGTLRSGHPPQLMPMEHTNLVDWNRPIVMATADSWVAPFDRSLPRLASFADLPSLPNPDVGPSNGLPHHQQTLDYQARERAKQVSFTHFRILYNEATGQHRVQILWCRSCGPDPWEQFCSDLSQTFTEMVPVIRGIAMICSYVPGLGTAVAFLINTSTSLLEGQRFDAAFLDGIGGALPGQPVSGMAFTATRSLINGDRIDKAGIQTALAALPVDPQIRNVIGTAVEIAINVARGENVTTIALDQIRQQLPVSGQRAMDIARRVCGGENVGGIISEETIAAARSAVAQGEAAANSFVAQAGFQDAMDLLAPPLQDAIRAGIAIGVIEAKSKQFIGTFGSVPEKNVAVNETHLQKGQRLIAAGAKYRGKLVSDILKGDSFTIAIDQFDALTGARETRTVAYKTTGPWTSNERPLTDAWRRGFIIALGACDGCSERGPGQTAVYQTMAEAGGRDGFDAGQAVAWWTTTHDIKHHVFTKTEMRASSATSSLLAAHAGSTGDQGMVDALAVKGQSIALRDPLLTAMRQLEPEGPSQMGFEIGIAIGDDDTAWGPGKQAMIDSLPVTHKDSAERAAHFIVDRNAKTDLAIKGAAIAKLDTEPEVVSGRATEPAGYFTLGFDIASALFGDPSRGGMGHTSQGPGSDAIRNSLPPAAIRGFDASVRLHMGK